MTKYARPQILLHWLTFALLLPQFLFHEWIKDAFDILRKGGSFAFDPLVMSHVGLGFVILTLALARLWLRRKHPAPPLPAEEAPWQKAIAHIVHYGLYAVLILMPISGAVAWFGLNHDAAEVHEILKFTLLALFGLHLVGAIYHQRVLKTNILARMSLRD